MKCYNHSDIDAVAICKNCQKGLCKDCAVEVGNGIACKDKCEQDVQSINEMIKRSMKSQKKIQLNASRGYYINALFAFLAGGSFIGFGIKMMMSHEMPRLQMFTISLGVVFVIVSALYFTTGKKVSRIYEIDRK